MTIRITGIKDASLQGPYFSAELFKWTFRHVTVKGKGRGWMCDVESHIDPEDPDTRPVLIAPFNIIAGDWNQACSLAFDEARRRYYEAYEGHDGPRD